MEKYRNLSGRSGVSTYEIGANYILIVFVNDNHVYVYNYIKPGKSKVERMKELATRGQGLSTYISQVIRGNYFRKL